MILNEVGNKINSIYLEFIENECPDFLERNGKVHILGHSLGSVICFDLLSNQHKPSSPAYSSLPQKIVKESAEEADPGVANLKSVAGGDSSKMSLLQSLKYVHPEFCLQTIGNILKSCDDQFQTFLDVCYDKNVQLLKERFSNISIAAQYLNANSPVSDCSPPSPSHHLEPPPLSNIVYPPLLFTVQNLFLIGSPLGMFLTSILKFFIFFSVFILCCSPQLPFPLSPSATSVLMQSK